MDQQNLLGSTKFKTSVEPSSIKTFLWVSLNEADQNKYLGDS